MPKTKQRKTKKKQIADRELRYRLIAILILFILLIAALKTGAVGIFLDNIFGKFLQKFILKGGFSYENERCYFFWKMSKEVII